MYTTPMSVPTTTEPGVGTTESRPHSLKYKRAVATFAGSYVAIEIVAAMFSILIAAITHANFSGNHADVHNHAFVTSERYYPLINLGIWMFFAWIYFKKPARVHEIRNEAARLGALWLVMALPCDVLFFILIKSPYSLSFHDFYVGQIPWIYVVYFVVFVSPLCYVSIFCRDPQRQVPRVH